MQIRQSVSDTGASQSDISKLEDLVGATLPEEYRQFLVESNGGKPQKRSFDCADGDNGGSVRAFFALSSSSKPFSLEKACDIYEGRIPSLTLPIACDSFGNLILLSLDSNRQRGSVYFWDHEEEDDEEEEGSDWTNVYLAAASFREFTDSLY
ncbi:MAG: SMI1/KNR4 family protein [Fuerstiella sp.]